MKDRLRLFEGTTTTGFGFHKQPSFTQQNMNVLNQTQHPSSNMNEPGTELKMVQVNEGNLKKLNTDPVAGFLETVHKMILITSLPPNLKKDLKQIQIENFYRATFGANANGATIKTELLKL